MQTTFQQTDEQKIDKVRLNPLLIVNNITYYVAH